MKLPKLKPRVNKPRVKKPRKKLRLKIAPSGESAQKSIAKIKLLTRRSGARFVLFIGDEGAILVYIKDNVVQSRQFVTDSSDQNINELKNTLAIDTKAPVLMVLDSMDQTYVQQTLPPVSSLSVNKLIKRRLDRDFGANDIKGAIILGREKTGRKDWNFLMVSLEKSRSLTAWLDFVSELPNRFQGIYLVSVEVENIIKELERGLGVPKEGTGSQWKFFVSHNKVGGFRQVILQNGRILFTRLAQPIGEFTPEVMAGNIEQEMLSTIEYMRRLAFDPSSGLDIYIIVSEGIKSVLDKSKFHASNVHILTPYEVSQYLGIEGATQPTDQFGDVILASGVAHSRKHVLTLTTPASRKYEQLFQLFRLQRMVAMLAVIASIFYAGSICYDIYSEYANKEDLDQKRVAQQRNLETLRQEISQSNVDVDKTGDIIDLYQLLIKQQLNPFAFIAKVETVLKPPIVIKDFTWSLEEKQAAGATAAAVSGLMEASKMIGVFTLEFPGVQNIEAFRVVSKKILSDLKTSFPGYDIAFTRLPPRFSESEKLDMTFGNKDTPQPPAALGADSLDVQLTIKEGTPAAAAAAPAEETP